MSRLTIALVALAFVAAPPAVLAQQEAGDERVGQGGRIEVPSAGYALTFPEDWIHIRPTEGDTEAILDAVAQLAPGFAPTVEAALAGGLSFSLLAVRDTADGSGSGENCNILDRAADGRPLEVVAASEVEKLDALGDLIASGPDLSFIELSSGRVARIDAGVETLDMAAATSSFILIDANWIHTMTCTAEERPDDAWGSIVGTFELRPTID